MTLWLRATGARMPRSRVMLSKTGRTELTCSMRFTRLSIELLSLFLSLDLARRRDTHHSMIVAIETVGQLFDFALFLHFDSKSLVRAATLNAQREIAFQIRTAISRVMILVMFFIAKHVDAIEIGLIHLVRFFRRTSFENHPTAGPRFLRHILGLGR